MRRASPLAVWMVAFLLALNGAAAGAQRVQSSVLLGATGIKYAGALGVSALTLHPTLSVQSERAFLAGLATYSRPVGGGSSTQGQLAGTFLSSSTGAVAGELSASVGGSSASDGARTGEFQLQARGHLGDARRGLWLGVGAGSAWDGAAWRANRLGELGGWIQYSDVSFVASLSPVMAGDTLRYTDIQVSARRRTPTLDLDGVIGARGGSRRPRGVGDPGAWISVSAAARLSPRLAAIASAGSYPVDLLQGYPAGRFIMMGLRISGPGSSGLPPASTSQREPARGLRSRVTGFRVTNRSDGRAELRLHAPVARTVEVMGDFTGWEPVALEAAPDGWWIVTLRIPAGRYEVNIRLDGGAWIAPPSLPTRKDEFGTVSGIIVVR